MHRGQFVKAILRIPGLYKTGLTSIGCGSFSIASQTMINVEASAPGQIHGVVLGTMLAVNCAEPMTNKGTSAGSRQF